jgi:uncharacterized protein involved in type VI secretion and phage assembly
MNLERVVADLMEKVERRYYGKYRGFVVDNADPANLGRLKLKIPSVLGSDVVTGWAMACAPFGGIANQGFLFIPERDTGVWVEFEEGDLEFPIWVGTFWSKPGDESELPRPNNADGTEQGIVQDPITCKIIKTKKGHTLQFEDADDGEMITLREGKKGHVLTMDQNGIKVTDAKGNFIEMKDDSVTVSVQVPLTIKDSTGNTIAMKSDGFTITSKVPFKIDASGQAVTIIGDTIDFNKG